MTKSEPEFSRVVMLEELLGGPVRRSIEAGAEECRELARRLGLAAIDTLSAMVTVEACDGGRLIVVSGHFQSALTQTCVVTLEPLSLTISDSFTERLTVALKADEAPVVDIDPEAEDEPEPIEGDAVDVGELVAQQLALALDPYPRAEGASLEPHTMVAGAKTDDGPFAQLARLKSKG